MKLQVLILSLAFVGCLEGRHFGPNFIYSTVGGYQSRIINGHDAGKGEVPYIVGLTFAKGDEYWWCGGSIIADIWVLTAAHCTRTADSVYILYGSTKREEAKFIRQVQSSDFVQADFNESTAENDIALIRTPHVDFDEDIGQVQLADPDQSYADATAKACGWGAVPQGGDQPENLQCADLQIISNEQCSEKLGQVADSILCTNTDDGTTTSSGDSGGPLVTLDGGKLVGVSSFFGTVDGKVVAAAFTRVSSHLDWIREATGIQ